MTLWLVRRGPPEGSSRNGLRERINADVEPCTTVTAQGISGVSDYWLEDDLTTEVPPLSLKPPYRVPTMSEVRALPPCGLTVASTFSGCGGSSLGYRMAGYRVLWASEFVAAARDSYRANADPRTVLDERDIRVVKPEEVLEACGLREGELDLLDGSPPCASFSTAGNREKDWGKTKAYSDTKQRTDDLFFEYVRLLRGVKPRAFVAENVSGLVKGTAKGMFLEVLRELKASGYRVRAKVLDAKWLGVPQSRQRLIFVGVRDDLGLDPVFPAPLPYFYSVRDALPWIGRVNLGPHGFSDGKSSDAEVHLSPTVGSSGMGSFAYSVEAAVTVKGHGWFEGGQIDVDGPAPTLPASPGGAGYNGHEVSAPEPTEGDISRYEIGREWDNLKPGEQSERFFSLVKADPDAPSPCVTQTGGNLSAAAVVHPTEKRKFTIAELRRICGFPDDFILTGSYAQQWERLGRAVPPVMMSHVAAALRDGVLLKVAR